MNPSKKKAGRPRLPENKRVVKINTSYSPDNYKYIMEILEAQKMQRRGNFVKVVNEIIADHRKVRRYKEKEAAKLKGQLGDLE